MEKDTLNVENIQASYATESGAVTLFKFCLHRPAALGAKKGQPES